MSVHSHVTRSPDTAQAASLSDAIWSNEIVPRLPADLDQQARSLKAFSRTRGLSCPSDLVRALLTYVLDQLSFRSLGAWAVLIGLADISDTAWRKRLIRANPFLLWLLGELLAASVQTAPDLLARKRRVLLVDATRLKQIGGTGDDWRVHLAYDLMLARMADVCVSDKHTAEKFSHFGLQAQDIVVADCGYGYRKQVACVQDFEADVVVRVALANFPLEDADGLPFDAASWVLSQHGSAAEWSGWYRHNKKRYRVRLLAMRLPADKIAAARARKRRKAQKNGHKIGTQTLALAAYLVLITTLESSWSTSEVLRLYRARWQVELVFKRLKQLLRVAQLRCRKQAAVEASIRAVLLAWALQEQLQAEVQAVLPNGERESKQEASSWRMAAVLVTSLRIAVRGRWTLARVVACMERLVRFLVGSPRERTQQEGEVRKWLYQRLGTAASSSGEISIGNVQA